MSKCGRAHIVIKSTFYDSPGSTKEENNTGVDNCVIKNVDTQADTVCHV